MDKFQIKITDTSLGISNLEASEVLLGEAFYPDIIGYHHSCIPNASFTFSGTELNVYAITDISAANKIKLNFIDIVGSPQSLFLPISVRRDNILRRGLECECKLCDTGSTIFEKDFEKAIKELHLLSSGDIQSADSQNAVLSYLSDKFRFNFGIKHPTITIMLYRLAYFQAVKQKWKELNGTLQQLLEAIAVTHRSFEQKALIHEFMKLIEAGNSKQIQIFAIDFFKKKRSCNA
ncbi:histone-lysine N-methyltransferase SMYD3-like protein [Leptotrombidium deliense]|uniref:Histone-lysine N-methyltransferase SMYD3-like protein n=1 Tax=Leptotrombidium deliense TaxID=299467 RepID=A0A443STY8_9ACAR|nr:histone-lysine N-methyltransferase SMYD3-like protein [Leptotrombidium deliense]